ncbi:MAG: polymer-forming cytoskeletal protein [Anaerolineae bacterium]|nr:polymer-forming cytoskeletal protein [Anaerolineae bacterium]
MNKFWIKCSGMLAVLMIFGLLFVAVTPVQAAEITDDGTVGADEVIDDDLLIAAEIVTIEGLVTGSVIAMGSQVEVNGTVEGDLFVFGQTVEIGKDARIGGNLFAGAAEVIVKGTVAGSIFGGASNVLLEDGARADGNLYVGAYNLGMEEETFIGRDLFYGGMQTRLAGEIADDARIAAEAVELSGTIGGDMQVEISSTQPHDTYTYYSFNYPGLQNPPPRMQGGLNITDAARIAGELTIITNMVGMPELGTQPEGGVVLQTPVPDTTEENTPDPHPGWEDDRVHFGPARVAWHWMRNNIGRFMALAILGSLVLWLCRKPFEETVAVLRTQPWASLGYGAASFFGGYLAALIAAGLIAIAALLVALLSFGKLGSAAGTLGFSSLAVVFTAFNLAVSHLSKLVVAFWLGRVILKPQEGENAGRAWLAALIGITLYAVARAIPVLGWFIGVTATFFGLGAIVMWCYRWWQQRRASRKPANLEAAPVEVVEPLELGEGSVEENGFALPE